VIHHRGPKLLKPGRGLPPQVIRPAALEVRPDVGLAQTTEHSDEASPPTSKALRSQHWLRMPACAHFSSSWYCHVPRLGSNSQGLHLA